MASHSTRVQQITAVAPLVCAVHCLALPIAIALLPELGLFASPAAERALYAGTAVLALGIAGRGVRTHGRSLPLLAVVALLIVWGATLWAPVMATREHAVSAVCSAGIAASLWWSIRLQHRRLAHGCPCGACDTDAGDA